MALNLSKERLAILEEWLKEGKPYDEDDPRLRTLDGNQMLDDKRWAATLAKKWLEQDRREKEAAGLPYNDDPTE